MGIPAGLRAIDIRDRDVAGHLHGHSPATTLGLVGLELGAARLSKDTTVRGRCSGMFLFCLRTITAYLFASRAKTAHASMAEIWVDSAGWLSPAEDDVLPGSAVCVVDADPDAVPLPVPFPTGVEEAAVPGVPLTVVLGMNGTPFIIACTAIPSPTLIQSSCAHTHTNRMSADSSLDKGGFLRGSPVSQEHPPE